MEGKLDNDGDRVTEQNNYLHYRLKSSLCHKFMKRNEKLVNENQQLATLPYTVDQAGSDYQHLGPPCSHR